MAMKAVYRCPSRSWLILARWGRAAGGASRCRQIPTGSGTFSTAGLGDAGDLEKPVRSFLTGNGPVAGKRCRALIWRLILRAGLAGTGARQDVRGRLGFCLALVRPLGCSTSPATDGCASPRMMFIA